MLRPLDSLKGAKLVDIVGLHLEATSGAPLILLREHDAPHRVLPIFIGVPEAAATYMAVSGQTPPRPFTHDAMAALVESLDARVERVELTDLHDGTFVAELAVSGPGGGRRLDTRPSDAITLAVRVDAPLYVSDAVLDEAATVLIGVPGDAAIDEEVARFRSPLDHLDPADFAAGPVPEPPPAEPANPTATTRPPATPPTNRTPDTAGPPARPDAPVVVDNGPTITERRHRMSTARRQRAARPYRR